jgi:hypothetical protein
MFAREQTGHGMYAYPDIVAVMVGVAVEGP